MIQNVPGGAIFEAPGGSAAARPSQAEQRPSAETAGAADNKTSAAQDATRADDRARPAAQTAGAERPSDDAPRGGSVDISV